MDAIKKPLWSKIQLDRQQEYITVLFPVPQTKSVTIFLFIFGSILLLTGFSGLQTFLPVLKRNPADYMGYLPIVPYIITGLFGLFLLERITGRLSIRISGNILSINRKTLLVSRSRTVFLKDIQKIEATFYKTSNQAKHHHLAINRKKRSKKGEQTGKIADLMVGNTLLDNIKQAECEWIADELTRFITDHPQKEID